MYKRKCILAVLFILIIVSKSFSIFFLGNVKEIFKNKAQIKLARAASIGFLRGIDKALEMGADVNYIGDEETTPLIWTLREQNRRSFEYLLKKGVIQIIEKAMIIQ